jgi:hypothetical protein
LRARAKLVGAVLTDSLYVFLFKRELQAMTGLGYHEHLISSTPIAVCWVIIFLLPLSPLLSSRLKVILDRIGDYLDTLAHHQ